MNLNANVEVGSVSVFTTDNRGFDAEEIADLERVLDRLLDLSRAKRALFIDVEGHIEEEKVRITGNKAGQKLYYRHSGYPGGFKSVTLEKTMREKPTRVIEHAVRGMLPHTRLGDRMRKRLTVYAGETGRQLVVT